MLPIATVNLFCNIIGWINLFSEKKHTINVHVDTYISIFFLCINKHHALIFIMHVCTRIYQIKNLFTALQIPGTKRSLTRVICLPRTGAIKGAVKGPTETMIIIFLCALLLEDAYLPSMLHACYVALGNIYFA